MNELKNKVSFNEYLRIDMVQRMIYLGIILTWIFTGINFVMYKYDSSPFKVDMFYALIIPIISLIGPIILNRKFLWIFPFGIALIHAIWTTSKIIFDLLIDINRDYIPKHSLSLKNIGTSTGLIIGSFFITWIIWKIKPIK